MGRNGNQEQSDSDVILFEILQTKFNSKSANRKGGTDYADTAENKQLRGYAVALLLISTQPALWR